MKHLKEQLANIIGGFGIIFTLLYSVYVDSNAVTFLVA